MESFLTARSQRLQVPGLRCSRFCNHADMQSLQIVPGDSRGGRADRQAARQKKTAIHVRSVPHAVGSAVYETADLWEYALRMFPGFAQIDGSSVVL